MKKLGEVAGCLAAGIALTYGSQHVGFEAASNLPIPVEPCIEALDVYKPGGVYEGLPSSCRELAGLMVQSAQVTVTESGQLTENLELFSKPDELRKIGAEVNKIKQEDEERKKRWNTLYYFLLPSLFIYGGLQAVKEKRQFDATTKQLEAINIPS